MKSITLIPGREKSLKNKHPWVFKSAVKPVHCESGEIVQVCLPTGEPKAIAFYNSKSQISLRIFSWQPQIQINSDFWKEKLIQAINKRKVISQTGETDSCRLVFGEADGLPGLIIDSYGNYLSLQFVTAGMDKIRNIIVELLIDILNPLGIIEKSDAEMCKLEGNSASEGLLWGQLPPDDFFIHENGIKFHLNFSSGQKTGYYLDQRENRKKVGLWAEGRTVLDAFCYTGGFTINALKSGAVSIHCVDSSKPALEGLKANLELNQIKSDKIVITEADAFQYLRNQNAENQKFDMVILDPPKLAPTKVHLDKAMRAYKDINLQGMKLLSPGGILATFSCSGGLSLADLKMVCAWAALDAGRSVSILEVLSQPYDHPISLQYPESEYLKGLIMLVD